MKDDAISRKAVIDFITDIERRALDKSLKISNGNSDEVMKTVLATAKAIRGYCKLAPPAQPERKTGKWIPLISTSDRKRHEWCGYQCSICGERTLRLTQCNFCPHCGSYNGGERDEHSN